MRRDLEQLSSVSFDLLVVGGGIHGAWIAWEATLHGLTVALVEQSDFGGATSANSQRIVHGGFRYLQHLDISRLRQSARERAILLRLMPHLVIPLPVLLPTSRRGMQRRAVMRAALALYDLLTWDRNRRLRDSARRIPASRLLSRAECLAQAPGQAGDGITGAAVWFDGQIDNTERLTLAVVRAAAERGACMANHVEAAALRVRAGRVTGIAARDRLTGRTFDVRGRLVVNAAGPWVNRVLGRIEGRRAESLAVAWSKTTCALVRRPLTNGCALSLALPAGRQAGGERRLFLTPWRGRTLVGSTHTRLADAPQTCEPTPQDAADLLAALNAAYPSAAVSESDIGYMHVGLLPLDEAQADPARLLSRPRFQDHERTDGLPGLLSVLGIKYTTARAVAEQAVRRALRALGRKPARASSRRALLWGTPEVFLEALQAEAKRTAPLGVPAEVVEHLVHMYGAAYPELFALVRARPELGQRLADAVPVIAAQVVHAIRHEAACTLEDVVRRRTELGLAGALSGDVLERCGRLMADELGWDAARLARELGLTEAMVR